MAPTAEFQRVTGKAQVVIVDWDSFFVVSSTVFLCRWPLCWGNVTYSRFYLYDFAHAPVRWRRRPKCTVSRRKVMDTDVVPERGLSASIAA